MIALICRSATKAPDFEVEGSKHGYNLFLECCRQYQSFKLPLFGHGPDHV